MSISNRCRTASSSSGSRKKRRARRDHHPRQRKRSRRGQSRAVGNGKVSRRQGSQADVKRGNIVLSGKDSAPK